MKVNSELGAKNVKSDFTKLSRNTWQSGRSNNKIRKNFQKKAVNKRRKTIVMKEKRDENRKSRKRQKPWGCNTHTHTHTHLKLGLNKGNKYKYDKKMSYKKVGRLFGMCDTS